MQDIERLFGPIEEGAFHDQLVLEQAFSNDQAETVNSNDYLAQPTFCRYRGIDSERLSIEISIDQFANPEHIAELWLPRSIYRSHDPRPEINEYAGSIESAKDETQESDAMKLIDELHRSVALVESSNELRSEEIDGSIAFVDLGDKGFHAAHRNTIIEVRVWWGEETLMNPAGNGYSRSNTEMLAAIWQIFQILFENIDNPELDQSVLPTQFHGKWNEPVHGVHVLEPCRILDGNVASLAVGTGPDPQRIRVRSVRHNLRNDPGGRFWNKTPAHLNFNRCTRHAAMIDPITFSYPPPVTAEIYYLTDVAASEDDLLDQIQRHHYWSPVKEDEYLDIKEDRLTNITSTNADALYLHAGVNGTDAYFMVAPYIVRIEGVEDYLGNEDGAINDQMLVDIVNAMVENIKE